MIVANTKNAKPDLIYGLVVVILALFVFTSYRYWSRRSKFQIQDISSAVKHDGSLRDLKKVEANKYAVIDTSNGAITLELYKEGSPEVVDEFIRSCLKGLFKGMLFNHVIKNFMIQGRLTDLELLKIGHRGKHYNQLDTRYEHPGSYILYLSQTLTDET